MQGQHRTPTPVILRRRNLRPRTHDFCLPEKDDNNFITRVFIDLVELFYSHSVHPFSLYCTMLRFVTMISLNEDTYIHAYILLMPYTAAAKITSSVFVASVVDAWLLSSYQFRKTPLA